MNLSKTYIQVPSFKQSVSTQMTLDSDFNVTDSKPDIERLVQEKGSLNIQEIKTMNEKCLVRGQLDFCILYIGDDGTGQLQSLNSSIPFEEVINIDGLNEDDEVSIKWDLEDLRSGLINSRKFNIRSIVLLRVNVSQFFNEEAATAMENSGDLWVQNSTLCLNQCVLKDKDQIRIRDEVHIPANRPNMMNIIWHQDNLENLDIKLQDGYIWIQGMLSIFVLYHDEMMENQINDVELNVPIDTKIDRTDVKQEMIPDIKVQLEHLKLEVHDDADGEARIISIEAVLITELTVYQEESFKLLKDIYSPKMTYKPEIRTLLLEQLIFKNKSSCPIRERIHLNSNTAHILQICHARANIQIDQMEKKDSGISVEGAIALSILYISSDDRKPLNSSKQMIPFSYKIETDGIMDMDRFEIDPSIEQLGATMLDSDEMEVRMNISLDTSVFKNVKADIVSQVIEEKLDFEKIESMPSIVGHVVLPEDTLWNLAKTYYAVPEEILEINNLTEDTLPVGKPIIVMKNMEIFK